MDKTDAIPEFTKAKAGGDLGVANMSALASGPGIRSLSDVLIIALVAVVIIGGMELHVLDLRRVCRLHHNIGKHGIADEVVVDGRNHAAEQFEPFPLPFDQWILLTHRTEVDALL